MREHVDRAVAKAKAERLEKGIKPVGRKNVLRQDWNDSPNTREPRRGMSPRDAGRNKWARIEALQRNQTFLDLYRAAREDQLAGREALFPAGTWWLCRFAGLKCEGCGATPPAS